MSRRSWLMAVFVTALLSYPFLPAVSADPLARVGSLTVASRLGEEKVLALNDLLAFEQHEIRTETRWTEGIQTFSGPLVRDVLGPLIDEDSVVRATALNDYWVDIPAGDFLRWDVIIAVTQNGAPMPVHEKGPYWIIYPENDMGRAATRELAERWIWQLMSFQVRP